MNSRGQTWIVVAIAFICILVFVVIAYVVIPLINRPVPSPPSGEKEYQEIHVETICNNETWIKLQLYCQDHPETMLMLLVLEYWPSDQNQVVRQRYLELAQLPNPLGLTMYVIPYEDQLRVIRFGRDYLEGLNITVTHFAPSYWSYNRDTVQACKATGLVYFHLWEPLTQNLDTSNWNVTVVSVKEYTHDYEL